PTISPSMDIIISSNLERLLYDMSEGNARLIANMMEELNKKGYYIIPDSLKDRMELFYGGYSDEASTLLAIEEIYNKTNYVVDTHTAVAYSVYMNYLDETKDHTKTIIAS